jgi:phosphatidylglycerophosphate synthase
VQQGPNILTVLRLILAWPVADQLYRAFVHYGHGSGGVDVLVWAAAVLVLFASDGLDGTWAHQVGCVSGFGKLVDPIADKALVGFVLVNLGRAGFGLLALPFAQTVAVMMGILLCLEATLSAIAIAEQVRGRRPQADSWGKFKLATEGGACVAFAAGLWFVAAGYGLTGNTVIVGTLAGFLTAMYLALRSIRGHWRNLRGTA